MQFRSLLKMQLEAHAASVCLREDWRVNTSMATQLCYLKPVFLSENFKIETLYLQRFHKMHKALLILLGFLQIQAMLLLYLYGHD